jgi:hypothetical protein
MLKMFKHYYFNKSKRFQYLSASLVILVVASMGTLLLIGSHAATPYASTTADSGTLSGGATKQTCTGASDGNCVVFGGTTTASSIFPIGVYDQPTSLFATWKSRGVNTLVNVPDGDDETTWNAAAEQDGMYMIRQPAATPSSDENNPWLIAWLLGDEPELNGVSASSLITQYQQLKSVDSKIPVMLNFAGGYVLGLNGSCDESCYQAYGPAFDWGSNDIYPVTGYDQPNNLGLVGQAVTQLYQWFPGRPEFAFVETSDQLLPWIPNDPAPTPAEVGAEIWDEVIHGARGITYFPLVCPNGDTESQPCTFSFDGTPADVVTEITTQDALVESLAAPLLAPLNPSNQSVTVSSPLEASWRVTGSTDYVIVLNLSSSTLTNATIQLTGFSGSQATVYSENRTVPVNNNTITDTFAPDQVHIYQF